MDRGQAGRLRHGPRLALVALAGAAILAGCGSPEPDPSVAARGEQLYQAHCVACHGGATGGDIADIPPPHNAEGHTWHHPDCQLVEIVLEGMPPRTGSPGMAPFADRLDETDVRAILAHIRTWWEPDQREWQAEVTEESCG